ncbi:MAG: prenyltransferase [Anaerolineales bacterium]|nr:prenyltransferase [Anaerolineales bacterium]
MNPSMWLRALQVIPKISRAEWDRLDPVSRWLIAARAAVLVLTFLSAAVAGLLAARDGLFRWGEWLLVTVGLVMAHAANNLLNDLIDYARGVDEANYFRTQYGPQTVQQGLLTKKQLLGYAAFSGAAAAACGLALAALRGWPVILLMAAGAFFVVFYTWPLKYIGLGELAVLLVWGPLMVGGGYYAVAGRWDWNAVLAGLPCALGAVTVIFGKHLDKREADKAKRIRTLPVLVGDRASRIGVRLLTAAQYVLVIALTAAGYFSWTVLAVLPAFYFSLPLWRIYSRPRPAEPPPEAGEFWPMWFVAAAFYHHRAFGLLFLAGLVLQLVWH